MKLLISRGPKFALANETATMVIEKVTPATPITDVAMTLNIALASVTPDATIDAVYTN